MVHLLSIIYFVYFSFLTSSLISYFINYRQTLLGADQRNYVVTAYYQSANIAKIIIQMLLAVHTGNYYIWAVVELSFGIIYSFILNSKINQVYPWLKSDVKLGKKLFQKYPDIIKYTKQLFIHKIGSVVYGQISPFLVYAFASLQAVAYYGNYTLIVSKLDGLVNNLLGSTSAGVGSLIAEGNKAKILKTYWELMAIRFLISSVFIFALYHLLPPFISLWLGKEYILSDTILVLVLISYFLGIIRGTNEQFILGYGLFADIWAPFVEALILIVVAIIGGTIWGFEGVLLGSIASTTLIIYVWKPYYLFKQGFKISIWKYWLPWIKHVFLMLLSFLISEFIILKLPTPWVASESWIEWIVCAFIIVAVQIVVSLVLFCLFIQGTRDFITRIKVKFLSQR